MEFFALLLIIATAQAAPLPQCNSDDYSPASGAADLQKNSTLQYCIIDNCTIMRTDTGQQLDIVYTTESLLVVTPTDGQTSMIIPKNEPELFCSTTIANEEDEIHSAAAMITSILIALISGYIAGLHLIFKELRTTFGKLLIYYNLIIVFRNIVTVCLHLRNVIDTSLPCYPFIFLFIQSEIATEGFSTCILGYLAFVMHHSLKVKQVTKHLNKKLYRRSLKYVLGSLLFFDIFIVSYDFGTGASKHTLLPNGQCSFNYHSGYDTITVAAFNNILNKILQVTFLVIYCVCYYKLNKMLKFVRTLAVNHDRQTNKLLCKIALMMGATIRASHFIFIFSVYAVPIPNAFAVGGVCLLLQQCLILILMMSSRKMARLCREKFSTTEASP